MGLILFSTQNYCNAKINTRLGSCLEKNPFLSLLRFVDRVQFLVAVGLKPLFLPGYPLLLVTTGVLLTWLPSSSISNRTPNSSHSPLISTKA